MCALDCKDAHVPLITYPAIYTIISIKFCYYFYLLIFYGVSITVFILLAKTFINKLQINILLKVGCYHSVGFSQWLHYLAGLIHYTKVAWSAIISVFSRLQDGSGQLQSAWKQISSRRQLEWIYGFNFVTQELVANLCFL